MKISDIFDMAVTDTQIEFLLSSQCECVHKQSAKDLP